MLNDTSFKAYTNIIPSDAYGKRSDTNCTHLGSGLFSGKKINGRNRVDSDAIIINPT